MRTRAEYNRTNGVATTLPPKQRGPASGGVWAKPEATLAERVAALRNATPYALRRGTYGKMLEELCVVALDMETDLGIVSAFGAMGDSRVQ